jgi:ketosteroid isomerase-like protein
MLQSRRSRREEPLDEHVPDQIDGIDPEREAMLADSVGSARLVVLDTLAPPSGSRSCCTTCSPSPSTRSRPSSSVPAAARQLASRARRRVQGAAAAPADLTRQREVVEAFLAASRNRDFNGLLAVPDPDVVLRADPATVHAAATRRAKGAPALADEVRGAAAVVDAFSGRAQTALALIDAAVGAVWAPGGKPRVVFGFTITDGKIVAIDLQSGPQRVRGLDVTILGNVVESADS